MKDRKRHDLALPRIPFSQIAGSHTFPDERGRTYEVQVKPASHYLLTFGLEAFTPAAMADYPNLFYRRPVVHEFKHYLPGGGKKWTSRCGMDLVFAFAAKDIHLVQHPGHSYVPVEIGGIPLTLNVSGGTGGEGIGWSDWVSTHCTTSVFPSGAIPRAIAAFAAPPRDFPGFDPSTVEAMWEGHTRTFTRKFHEKFTLPRLQPGMAVFTTDGDQYSFKERNTGRRGAARQSIIATSFQHWSIRFDLIDWPRTAEANGFTEKPDLAPVFSPDIRTPQRLDALARAALDLLAA